MTSPAVRLLVKGALFVTINALVALAVLKMHERTLARAPWETDSILLVMPEESHRDLVFLGTSRSYLFSRFREHHEATEKILGRSVFNMALPQGGGITPARFYLETYWAAGNTTDRVVFFLDPFVLYSPGANNDHKFVYFEPLQLRFLARMVCNGYNYQQIISYIRSKFSRMWLLQQPELLIHHTAHLSKEGVSAERIARRIDSLYYDGLREETFANYAEEFGRIAETCRKQDTPLTVVVLPTLLGPEPGHARMMEWLRKMETQGEIDVHDWVNAMPDYTKFYNLDHMNLDGVKQFMRETLRPALDSAKRDSPTS